MKFVFFLVLAIIAAASAFTFNSPAAVRAPRLYMAAVNNKNAKPAPKASAPKTVIQVPKGSYVPEGLTPEQYSAVLTQEAAAKEAKKQKFFKGKETESLTEWLVNNEKKGLKGLDLNRKGHRMVKAKFDGWYTNQSPV